MGETYAEITLKNAVDVGNAESGHISEKDVRQVTVRALADTGANMLVINTGICQKLGLGIKRTRDATVAGGIRVTAQMTSPVEIHWKDRSIACNAIVLADEEEVLLGVFPLEGLDLVVNPVKQILEGAHGEKILFKVK